jgi:hypothetical protein
MPYQPKLDLGCRVVAEFVDEAGIPQNSACHLGDAIRPQIAASYVDGWSPAGRNGGDLNAALSKAEEAVLLALVAKSKGLGWGVAVHPFEDDIPKLGMEPIDANIAVAGLQQRGLVRLEERADWDKAAERPLLYPVYCVTTQGFKAALQARSPG